MRKVLLLTCITFCIAATASAQITKGSVLLGGNIGAHHSKQTTTSNPGVFKQNGFYLSPSIGFVTKENTVWGGNLTYGHSKGTGTADDQTGNNYGAGLFFRKYLTLGKGFYLFGQATTGYSKAKQESVAVNANPKRVITNQFFGVNAYPGIAYSVSKKLHLEAGLNDLVNFGYSQTKDQYTSAGVETTSKISSLSFSTSASNSVPLTVGFRFVLGK